MLETKSAPYTFVKQGIFYFSRRVPGDLSHHYKAPRIIFSLRTRSAAVASARAQRAAQQLDEHWYHLRIRDNDLPGKHLLRMAGDIAARGAVTAEPSGRASVTLTEAVSIYLRLKGKDRPVTFHRHARRAHRRDRARTRRGVVMLPSQKLRILVATQPVDFRKGHDGLAALVQSALKEDPFTGTVFVFRAKRADRLKILFWDGSGLVMAYKRLEETTFAWPEVRDGVMTLNRAQFEALFAGLDWRRVRALEARRPAAVE